MNIVKQHNYRTMAKQKKLDKEINRIIKKQPVRLLKLVQAYIIKNKRVFKVFREEEQDNFIHEIWTKDDSLRDKVKDFLVDMMNNRELTILDEYQNKFWVEFNTIMEQFMIKNKSRLSNY